MVTFPFGKKKPAVPTKGRYIGMSTGAPQEKPKVQEQPKVVAGRGILAPMQPYLRVVHNDIKTLLKIDDKSRKDKMEYRDFMEHYFGKVPKKK